ncbi:MAG: radical SAM protein [Deltaproteobacteria bacterium]|nr:radical SAM protein [Deltaproteobacteria bacterium]
MEFRRARRAPRVLIITGSLLSPKGNALVPALVGQLGSFRASSSAWLDISYKVLAAKALAGAWWVRSRPAFARAPYRDVVERYFGDDENVAAPELTEVSLASLIEREGVDWGATTWADVLAGHAQDALASATVVFASSTLLRDRSELLPCLSRVTGRGRKVVLGGALVPLLDEAELPGVDVLAVGYGELLVPSIMAWIRSDFMRLVPPEGGRVEARGSLLVLSSGVPKDKSLDFLPEPDWSLAERWHGRPFRMVHYESVRGCPYRCAFCNYPYLFDDTKFRTKSASRIAEDWQRLAKLGVRWVSCLDSLFTMPRRRLVELCDRLIALGSPVSWICYARADDLIDEAAVRRMKAAGCEEVQIGIESGDQKVLDAMNKRTTVEKNRRALEVCRAVGLTSLVTVIVGYPGETRRTVDATYSLLESAPPDFYHAAPFNTRVESVPILSDESRRRHELVTAGGVSSSAPYWRHSTMSCTEVPQLVDELRRRMAENRVALEGTLFYRGARAYRSEDRGMLLDFQRDALEGSPMHFLFDRAFELVERRLLEDVARTLAPTSRRLLPVLVGDRA